MPFDFFDKNKAQWHFSRENSADKRGYEPEEEEIFSDVLGSYTGTPFDGARPIQDADDL